MAASTSSTTVHDRPDPVAPNTHRRLHGDDGVAAIIVCLGLVGMLAVGAITVDGGRAYFERRAMQNAADASAMAGARALDQVHWLKHPDTYVDEQVRQQVASHGGSLLECHVLDYLGNRLQPATGRCDATVVAELRRLYGAQALGGIEVKVTSTVATFLGQFSGTPAMTVATSASATVQVFQGGIGAPFVLCGVPSADPTYNPAYPDPRIYDLDDPATNSVYAYPILLSAAEGYAVDINGIRRAGFDTGHNTALSPQQVIPLQASQSRSCNGGSSMKGKIDDDDILVGRACTAASVMCDLIGGQQGNGYDGEIASLVLTTKPCPPDFDQVHDCDMLLPIVDWTTGNGNDKIRGHVVGWASVHVMGDGSGNPKYYGTINVDATRTIVSGGYSAAGPIGSQATPRVIKLIR